LVERGCIPFLCKLISQSQDLEICEEAVLVCISMSIGGNILTQNAFLDYLVQEDSDNKFLLTIKGMLVKQFELTKKYLTEKNAKLELINKLRKQNEAKKKR